MSPFPNSRALGSLIQEDRRYKVLYNENKLYVPCVLPLSNLSLRIMRVYKSLSLKIRVLCTRTEENSGN